MNVNGPFLPLNDKNFLLDFVVCLRMWGGGFPESSHRTAALFSAHRSFPHCFALSKTLFDFHVCGSPPRLEPAVHHLLSYCLCRCLVLFKRILGEMIIPGRGALCVSISPDLFLSVANTPFSPNFYFHGRKHIYFPLGKTMINSKVKEKNCALHRF